MENLNLFALPSPRRFHPTMEQLALMDLIALRDGSPLGEIRQGQRVTLRHLIVLELVSCRAFGPAIYVLTPVGRLVRERSMSK